MEDRSEGKKMKGNGEGKSEGAHENDYGELNNDIKITRPKFVKASAAFDAAAAGIPPYNLTDIAEIILKEDVELIVSGTRIFINNINIYSDKSNV